MEDERERVYYGQKSGKKKEGRSGIEKECNIYAQNDRSRKRERNRETERDRERERGWGGGRREKMEVGN